MAHPEILHEYLEEELPGLPEHLMVLHQEGQDGVVVLVLGQDCRLQGEIVKCR